MRVLKFVALVTLFVTLSAVNAAPVFAQDECESGGLNIDAQSLVDQIAEDCDCEGKADLQKFELCLNKMLKKKGGNDLISAAIKLGLLSKSVRSEVKAAKQAAIDDCEALLSDDSGDPEEEEPGEGEQGGNPGQGQGNEGNHEGEPPPPPPGH